MGLEDIVSQRIGKKLMGFAPDAVQGEGDTDEEREAYAKTMRQVTPDDVVQYGMIPEFVGRLPVVTTLAPLGEDDLMRVLREPKNALVRQYQRLFEIEDKELEFTDDSLRLIVQEALTRDTGARATRAIFEEVMLDIMYELSTHKDVNHYVITPEVVRGEAKPFKKSKAKAKRSGGKRKTKRGA